MENVSKVFLISAGVLIALMVLAIMIRMFDAGASISETVDAAQITRQQELYNSKFEVFDKPDNNIIDIVSAMNLAYSINEASEYEPTSAVSIILKIDGEEFKILDHNPNPPSYTPAYESLKKNGFLYEKNKIKHNSNTISIYDLVNKPAKQLGIDTIDANEKLTRTYYGPVSYTKKYTAYVKDPDTGNVAATNVEEEVTEMLTVYKYIFNCTSIEYHNSSGKVKSMVFEHNEITDKKSPYYWHKDKYE